MHAKSWKLLVITIQALMLVVLGFLIASLIVLVIAPAYRRRVVRLATDELRRAIPVTEAEIRADKDRLRAQFAIRVHKLEAQGEQQKLSAARRMVEINQRDARIAALETEIEQLKSGLEENANARRVLEHTVTDRMPRLEMRLAEARQLLSARDTEVTGLKTETNRSIRALDEAMQINAQQRAEIDRMSTVLNTRAHAGRDGGVSDARFDAEVALKAEIEALRATTREQAALLSQLQSRRAGNGEPVHPTVETERLARDLANAEAALNSARATAEVDGSARAAAETQLTEMRAKLQDQGADIARLEAAVAAYEGSESKGRPGLLRDSKIASKAKINSLQAQLAAQSETVQKLRAELAASNERLARQASHFMEEMRRLGAGTRPASGEARRLREAPTPRTLADRIANARQTGGAPQAERAGAEKGKVAQYLKSLETANADEAKSPSQVTANDDVETTVAVAKGGEARPDGGAPQPEERREAAAKPKGRLLDRISSIKA